jgi:hypothetical protein
LSNFCSLADSGAFRGYTSATTATVAGNASIPDGSSMAPVNHFYFIFIFYFIILFCANDKKALSVNTGRICRVHLSQSQQVNLSLIKSI